MKSLRSMATRPLGRFFAADVTRIIIACVGGPMGIILRCAACGEVTLRALEIGPAFRLDARGAAYLTLGAG